MSGPGGSVLTDPGLRDNELWVISPREIGPYQLQGPYGEVGPNARWALLTDGIGATHQLQGPVQPGAQLGDWVLSNDLLSASITAEYRERRTMFTLTQDTRNDAVYQCGEMDLWVCALGPLPDVVVSQPGVLPFVQQLSLAEMAHLFFVWGESVVDVQIGHRCLPGFDAAIELASVYFGNQLTGQTFQYQIYTSDSRNQHPKGTYFVNLPNGDFFVVADNTEHQYGFPYLYPGGRPRIGVIDILPRVLVLLQNVPNDKVNTSPDQWKILMVTCGSFVNGAARIVSTVSDINLVAVSKV